MKNIKLSKGQYTIVNDEDFEWLNQYKWFLNSHGYAMASFWSKEEQKTKKIAMHRLINKTPEGLDTDHINRNRLDNRRENLRTVTRSENMMNIILHKDNKSGYKGVSWFKPIKKWRANIFVKGKQKSLGYFSDIQEAILAYKRAVELFFEEVK